MKEYTKPVVEKIDFSFDEQVVASTPIGTYWEDKRPGYCDIPGSIQE